MNFQQACGGSILTGRESDIGRDLLAELEARTRFLCDVGLGYLQLNRAAPTLSGGEAQRIRLAAQLGSNLQGVCYVLDEPTIGLHPRDNVALLDTLDRLRSKGNTLIVVEHDEDTIRRADHVIDLGPGAGARGGWLVAQGTAAELAGLCNSVTGRCLAAPLRHSRSRRTPVDRDTPAIDIRGAVLHNLRDIVARIPLGRLTVVTGVSGSGKSTLARDVLLANLRQLLCAGPEAAPPDGNATRSPAGSRSAACSRSIRRPSARLRAPVPPPISVFGSPFAGSMPIPSRRGCGASPPAAFRSTPPGGRCEACEGQGMQRIEMSFLPDVQVLCDVCGGRRFNSDTLGILFKGKSIGETLAMNVEDALEFFAAQPHVHHPLQLAGRCRPRLL